MWLATYLPYFLSLGFSFYIANNWNSMFGIIIIFRSFFTLFFPIEPFSFEPCNQKCCQFVYDRGKHIMCNINVHFCGKWLYDVWKAVRARFILKESMVKSHGGCSNSHEKWAIHVPRLMFQFSLSCFMRDEYQYSPNILALNACFRFTLHYHFPHLASVLCLTFRAFHTYQVCFLDALINRIKHLVPTSCRYSFKHVREFTISCTRDLF